MLTWSDSTSHRQGSQDRSPKAWTAEAGRFRLVITKAHIHYPGEWIMHVHPGVLDCHQLGIAAQEPALAVVYKAAETVFRKILTDALAAMDA
jgi:hypothetical protein